MAAVGHAVGGVVRHADCPVTRSRGCDTVTMRRRVLSSLPSIGLVAALVVGLVACGGDDPAAVPDDRSVTGDGASVGTTVVTLPQVSTTSTVPPLAVAESVFDALVTRDAAAIDGVLALTAVDSPAAVFVGHQARVAALLDEFAGPAPTSSSSSTTTSPTATPDSSTSSTTVAAPPVTASDGVGSVCATAFQCTTFAAPEFDAVGALRSFTVDGVPIAELVRSEGPDVLAELAPVRMRVVSAYLTSAGSVSVVIETVNESEQTVSPFMFAAVHRHRSVAAGSTGLVEAEGAWGPSTVAAGATAQHLLVFGEGPIDGEVLVSAVTADGVDVDLVVPLLKP